MSGITPLVETVPGFAIYFASANQLDVLGQGHYGLAVQKALQCELESESCGIVYRLVIKKRLGRENIMPYHAFVTVIDVLADIQKNCYSSSPAPDKVSGRQWPGVSS